MKCGIAWEEIKILVQLDLERSFFNDPFKQLPARLQTIVWPVTAAGGHSSLEDQRAGHQLTQTERGSWASRGHGSPNSGSWLPWPSPAMTQLLHRALSSHCVLQDSLGLKPALPLPRGPIGNVLDQHQFLFTQESLSLRTFNEN